ncbi:MAG: hypothetical protein ABSF95_03745 [Verrucomicrobiota bacterium]
MRSKENRADISHVAGTSIFWSSLFHMESPQANEWKRNMVIPILLPADPGEHNQSSSALRHRGHAYHLAPGRGINGDGRSETHIPVLGCPFPFRCLPAGRQLGCARTALPDFGAEKIPPAWLHFHGLDEAAVLNTAHAG